MSSKLIQSSLEEEESISNDHLEFINQQLDLHLQHLKGKTYSPKLLGISILLQSTSPALNNLIRKSGLIQLLTVNYLKRLTSIFEFTGGVNNSMIDYLSLRMKTLDSKDGYIYIIIDEVYSN
uniref:Uncharacterized protein n=1 Tax=Lepeophtheirus salmonis TaxID=72036 RepID=A0A0K2V1V3_LEPSM